MNTVQITITVLLLAAVIYLISNVNWSNNDLIKAFKQAPSLFRKLLLMSCILVVFIGYSHAQTKQYLRVETTHFKQDRLSSKTVKYEGGTIDIEPKVITIDKEAPKPIYYAIVSKAAPEAQDEGYYVVEYLCIVQDKKGNPKALKVVAFYSPKKELCDLVVKKGNTRVDYCIIDK